MPTARLPAVTMSPVEMMVTSPNWDRAEIATELSGPLAMSPEDEMRTSPRVWALMPMLPVPDTAMSPSDVMSMGPKLEEALMTRALLPVVAMSPNDRMVIAPLFVPAVPIVPTLMPAANVPVVAILPKELIATGPKVLPAAMPNELLPDVAMLPDDVIVRSAFCPLPWIPVSLPPVVRMSAVELMVIAPPLLAVKMPLASSVRMAKGP